MDPGETVEVSGEFLMAYGGRQGFLLQSSELEIVESISKTNEIDGAHATCTGWWIELDFAETATLTNGVSVLLHSPQYVDGYDYSPTRGVSNEALLIKTETYLPDRAIGKGLGERLLPGLDDFRYDHHTVYESDPPMRVLWDLQDDARNNGNTLYRPVQGPLYPLTPPKEPTNGVLRGWIEFSDPETDRSLPRDQREIQLEIVIKSSDGSTKVSGVKWSKNST